MYIHIYIYVYIYTNVKKISFTINYDMKHKVHLSKSMCGIFILDSILFLLMFKFLFDKEHGLFEFDMS